MNRPAELIKKARLAAGLTQAELARKAGTSQPSVAAYESGAKAPNVATLNRLLQAAGVQIEIAPLRHKSSRAKPLRQLLQERRDEVLRIASMHDATNVRVFGSVARGEERPTSDLDLLVDMRPGYSLLNQVRLRRELTKLLGVEVDVVTSGGLLERDGRILTEAIPV